MKYLSTEGLSYFWSKIKTLLDSKAKATNASIYYCVPNETSSTATLTATVEGITEYYVGLLVAIRMPFSNVASSTLNINGLGAKSIYYQNTTTSASRMPANSVVMLVYDTTTVSGGCFKLLYSYNSDVAVRQYQVTTDTNYPILSRYNTTDKTGTYDSTYTRFCSNVTINPSTATITATNFNGLATTATADANGNNIVDTYATKTDLSNLTISSSTQSIYVEDLDDVPSSLGDGVTIFCKVEDEGGDSVDDSSTNSTDNTTTSGDGLTPEVNNNATILEETVSGDIDETVAPPLVRPL
jgi:hypothetical protein